jgi:hypothetical protein
VSRILDAADRIAQLQPPWWLWNTFLVVLGVSALGSALLLHPGPDEFVYFPNGVRFGDTCAFITLTGQPCPQCGMTRSWVYAARGQWVTSFWYSPGGLALFLWIQLGAVIGAVRLITRTPDRLVPPWALNVGWVLFWLVGLYAVPWVLRLLGVNPLPG